MEGRHASNSAHVEVRRQLAESVPSFHQVCSENQTGLRTWWQELLSIVRVELNLLKFQGLGILMISLLLLDSHNTIFFMRREFGFY